MFSDFFAQAFVYLFAAVVAVPLAKRLGLGSALGYILAGVIIGVVLSIVWLVHVSANPTMPVLGHKHGSQVFRSVEEFPDSKTYPGLLVMRFDAGLHFGSSDALEDRLRRLRHRARRRLGRFRPRAR